ncbi:MAG: hypothetical protein QOI59_2425 [Gammaproteobacteria bacterium]|nr:hypothetical protein [Gammaproteobacteria bacterium]
MWRPFLFRRARDVGCLCRFDPLRERIESCTQRPYLLLLPIDDIAELDVGALQERYFCFNPLDCVAGHFDSVPNPARRARPLCAPPTIKTKLEVSLYP